MSFTFSGSRLGASLPSSLTEPLRVNKNYIPQSLSSILFNCYIICQVSLRSEFTLSGSSRFGASLPLSLSQSFKFNKNYISRKLSILFHYYITCLVSLKSEFSPRFRKDIKTQIFDNFFVYFGQPGTQGCLSTRRVENRKAPWVRGYILVGLCKVTFSTGGGGDSKLSLNSVYGNHLCLIYVFSRQVISQIRR